MKTANPLIDSMVETQSHFLNNWMDSAKKMQAAFTTGSMAQDGQSIYKEWMDKQMGILNNMRESSTNMFSNGETNPQDFFKNWFNQQATSAKQMADFNQSIYNSYSNFGKPVQDYMSNFGQMNNSFTNSYNQWMNTLNNTYDNLSRTMNNPFNKDMFSNFMKGSQMYNKMQDFFAPMTEAFQKGQFNMEQFKTYFTPDHYSNLTKQMFGGFYNTSSMKEVFDNSMKQVQNFFANQNNLSKEYFDQIKTMTSEFPNLMSGNMMNNKEFYAQMQNVFGKTFEPLMKLVTPGKDKENIENTIELMDKMAEYSIKQAELQMHLQTTAQKSMEHLAKHYSEKYSDPKAMLQMPSTQEMYNEWVKTNEQLYTDLFASEEFSKVKGDALNLSMDVKRHFEKQFETMFENFPVVFKSETDELHKTVHELKRQVKELQTKLAMNNAATVEVFDEDKNGKARKK
jgi:class III poly(R)-hydroxyalkanoic acid synthase PhaE subunit